MFSLDAIAQPCLGTQTHSYSPISSPTLPIGAFIPGQVITLTYTLQSFNGININWIHAFQIILGPGFTNLTPITAPGNPAGAIGNWVWDLQHTYPGGYNFGPGWRFINSGTAGHLLIVPLLLILFVNWIEISLIDIISLLTILIMGIIGISQRVNIVPNKLFNIKESYI